MSINQEVKKASAFAKFSLRSKAFSYVIKLLRRKQSGTLSSVTKKKDFSWNVPDPSFAKTFRFSRAFDLFLSWLTTSPSNYCHIRNSTPMISVSLMVSHSTSAIGKHVVKTISNLFRSGTFQRTRERGAGEVKMIPS